MKLAATGEVDLATSSAVPSADIASSVTVVPVGSSGTAVIVNALNPVRMLTKTQVRDIFAGTVVTWSAVGGAPEQIIVVIREATSALRGNFDAYFLGGKGVYRADAIELNTGDDIVRAVVSRVGVVSMLTISASLLSDTRIRPVAIDGVAATKENISAGRYPVVRPLFLVYNPKRVKPAIAAFLDFVRGAEGRRSVDLVTTGG
jgi:phosphate transport system substrate-binding protein